MQPRRKARIMPLYWVRALPGLLIVLAACDSKEGMTSDRGAAAKTGDAASACASNRECVERYGEHWVCRQPQQTCVSLLSPECTFVRGDDAAEDAIIIGVLAPQGVPGQETFEEAELVRQDFTAAVGGLPRIGETTPRPFVLLGCEFPYLGDPLPPAKYLIETIGVPAILGPARSADVINVAQNLAIPNGVLLMSPTAQADPITDLADDDLLFRTIPANRAAAPQLAAMVAEVERVVRAESSPSAVKVALVSARDTYGIASSSALVERMRSNGVSTEQNERQGNFLAVSYDAADPEEIASLAQRVVDFAPHVVVLLTAFDARAFEAIESSWPSQAESAPYYVTDAGGSSSGYASFVASRPDSLRKRVRIAVDLDPERPLYKRFIERLWNELNLHALPLVTAGRYDATYALAYGIVAAPEGPLTGRSIAKGIRRLVGGDPKVAVLPDGIADASSTLQRGKAIDLDGASGPLDFDERGDVTSDGAVACFVRQAPDSVSAVFGGQVYRRGSDAIEGTLNLCE